MKGKVPQTYQSKAKLRTGILYFHSRKYNPIPPLLPSRITTLPPLSQSRILPVRATKSPYPSYFRYKYSPNRIASNLKADLRLTEVRFKSSSKTCKRPTQSLILSSRRRRRANILSLATSTSLMHYPMPLAILQDGVPYASTSIRWPNISRITSHHY